MKIAYYISGHGFGHISRSFEIIKYILERKLGVIIYANTTRKEFVKEYIPNLLFRNIKTDVGVFQNTSISLDISKTLDELLLFEKEKGKIFDSEIEFLQKEKIDLIISDSSSFPFRFSNQLRIPSIFIGNFTWDFIYSEYIKLFPEFKNIISIIKEEYSLCNQGLILPFATKIDSIINKKNIGLIGRRSKLTKLEARKKFNFEKDKNYFLFSFGAYQLENNFQFENLSKNSHIVISGYEDLKSNKVINIADAYYPDLVTACDSILTKPGYGILSEAYFANTPILYTDRGNFAEYPFLVKSLKKFFRSEFITNEELFEMKFEEKFTKIPKSPKPKLDLESGFEQVLNEIFLLN